MMARWPCSILPFVGLSIVLPAILSCGSEPVQVRVVARFIEGSAGGSAPICLGSSWMVAFVHDTRSTDAVGDVSVEEVGMSQDNKCFLGSRFLVLKGIPLGRKLQLHVEVVDSSMEVLSGGESAPFKLEKNSEEQGLELEVKLARSSSNPGTVHLLFPDEEALKDVMGNDLTVTLIGAGLDTTRTIPTIVDRNIELDPGHVYLSGLDNATSVEILVKGADKKGNALTWKASGIDIDAGPPDWTAVDVDLNKEM